MTPFLLHLSRSALLAGAVLASPLLSAQTVNQTTTPAPNGTVPAAPPPIADFFDNPAFSGARLSPDAAFLAVRFSSNNGRTRLAVIDLANNSTKVVAQFDERDIAEVEWVNNERLVFSSSDTTSAPGDSQYGPGLFAVNRDGSDTRQLVRMSSTYAAKNSNTNMLGANHTLLPQMGQQNTGFVYVLAPKWSDGGELEHISLVRVDTLSGRSETVRRPGATRSWLLDQKGEPRIATVSDKNIQSIHYLDPASGAWRQLAAFDSYLGGKDAFTPLEFGPDGTLYALAYGAGKHTSALYTVDLATGKLSDKPLLALDGFDFDGHLVGNRERLLGIRYLSDARATAWLDPAMQQAQAKVDALLPGTVNLIDVGARASTPWVMVSSYSDRDPGSYALFNISTGRLNPVGQSHPRIRRADMASQELVHYQARDGLRIPAWLTIPKGAPRKNLPLVVLVHGGPYVRGGEWKWSADSQFLASRGYAVLEPEFRGSRGYGDKHYRAGWRQWGLAMQDDIADGARWAIAQGLVDRKRICIAGASYGGYATLMGLVKDPDLFRCGVSWVGVTDIALLYTGGANYFSDVSQDYIKYGMPALVGDLVKDAAQFKATSPVAQAARIKQPLLMAYGSSDTRVPLYHGKQFMEAVKPVNPNVEYVVYDNEGHGWSLPATRLDFWGRVEKFLQRNIGQP